jgi:DNA-binding protein HU-beta
MANITKDQIVDAVAARTDMTKKDVDTFLEALLDEVTVQMQKGHKVTFTGFGAFRVLERAARMGINPKTKERIQISAMKVPKFTAGKTLKEAVR